MAASDSTSSLTTSSSKPAISNTWYDTLTKPWTSWKSTISGLYVASYQLHPPTLHSTHPPSTHTAAPAIATSVEDEDKQLCAHHGLQCDCGSNSISHINTIYYQPTAFNQSLVDACPSLQSFCPPPLLAQAHTQTIVASLYRRSPGNTVASDNLLSNLTSWMPSFPTSLSSLVYNYRNSAAGVGDDTDDDATIKSQPTPTADKHSVQYVRELVKLSDNGQIALDWHQPNGTTQLKQHNKPMVLLMHGLTGGSHEAYAQWLVKYISSKTDCQVAVMNARGCGSSELTTPKPFTASNTNDLHEIISKIRREYLGADVPLIAVGISLSAGVLMKYTHEESLKHRQQQSTPPQSHNKTVGGLNAAIHLSASYDHVHNSWHMENQPFLRHVYNKTLGANLVKYATQHRAAFEDPKVADELKAKGFSFDKLISSKIIGEFDQNGVVPLFGYKDVQEYYRDACTNHRMKDLELPTLAISAEDDPICRSSCVPKDAPSQNSNVILAMTQHGGHVAWMGRSTAAQQDAELRDAGLNSCGYEHLPIGVHSWVERPVTEYINAILKQHKQQQHNQK